METACTGSGLVTAQLGGTSAAAWRNERMQEVRKSGGLLVAAVAILLVAAPVAGAEPGKPHFQPPYPKPFHLGNASEHTTGEGIVPVVFAAKSPEGETTRIVLQCQTLKGEGEVTGPETLTTTMVFGGCHSPATTPPSACTNTEKTYEIVAAPSNGELGVINESANAVGLRMEFNLEAVCHFHTSAMPLTIKGSAIGQITPVNTKSNRYRVRFTRSGYEQVPPSFEAGPPTVLVSALGAEPPEPTAVETTMFLTFRKVAEIKYAH